MYFICILWTVLYKNMDSLYTICYSDWRCVDTRSVLSMVWSKRVQCKAAANCLVHFGEGLVRLLLRRFLPVTTRFVKLKFRESVQIPVVLPSIGRTNNLIRPSQIGPHRPSTKLPSASKDDKLWIPTSSRSGQVYKYSSSGSETL